MSRIKNSPEFQRMMDEQELQASFEYQEREAEYIALQKELADDELILQASELLNKACTALTDAKKIYLETLETYINLLDKVYGRRKNV